MDIFQTIIEGLVAIWDYITFGVWVDLGEWFVLGSIKVKIFFLQISWSIASQLLETLSISPLIEQYWNALDSHVVYYLTFFRIPEALNIIIQASITRFVIGRF